MTKMRDDLTALRKQNDVLQQENATLRAKLAQMMQDAELAYLQTDAYMKTQMDFANEHSSRISAEVDAYCWRDKYEKLLAAKEQKVSTAELFERVRNSRRRRVTDTVKEKIFFLRQSGFSYAEIAKATGFSCTTVKRICRSLPVADTEDPE